MLDSAERFPFTARQQKQLWVVREVYSQQMAMYRSRSHRCDDRIVSFHQPHVRPIVRGKAGSQTEFGSKISVSLVEGVARVDRLSWDAFNESQDLQAQVERYKARYGCYPEASLPMPFTAPGTIGNSCRTGGFALAANRRDDQQNKPTKMLTSCDWQRSNGNRMRWNGFQSKENLARERTATVSIAFRARTAKTSEAWINTIFLVMNLMVLLRLWFAVT